MNKRYIDFVPVKQGKSNSKESTTPKREVKATPKIRSSNTIKAKPISSSEAKAKRVRASRKDVLSKATAKKPSVLPVEKPVEKSRVTPSVTSDPKMAIPKNPFINTSKVSKRPLSKNVYYKEVETPVEEPKGPVTIISKPEKGAHVSLIVTIILTIILGAAAGTVAFLLLPK